MGILNRHHDSDDVDVVKGPSLARLPTHLIGTVLLAFGLAALINHNEFPSAGDAFPDGTATGDTFLGIGVNGWTAWLCIATGGMLLLGAAQHVAARTMALIAGLVLGAAAIIALSDGDDVLGLAYANGATKLALGIAASVLLLIALLPRTRKTVEHDHRPEPTPAARDEHHAEPVASTARTGRFGREPEAAPAEKPALAGAAAERAHAAREQHAEPRTEVVGPSAGRTTATSSGPLGASPAPPAAPHRSGGLVGRLRRKDDR